MQFQSFFKITEAKLKFFHRAYFKGVKVFMVLLAITHLAAALWLATARHEIETGETETWFQYRNEEKATLFVQYTDAIEFAAGTMTSIGYGDIIPLTDIERLIALIIMIVGASTYASLFGTFVSIIDDLEAEERDNQQM